MLVFRDVGDRRRAEQAQEERSRLAALRADIGLALASRRVPPAALHDCCEALVRHLGVAFARVWTTDETGGVLELRASAGLYTHLDGPHSRVPVGQFKIGRIASTRQPHLTNAVPSDPNVSDNAWAVREGMVAFAGFPLVVEDRMLGVLAMFARRPLTDGVLTDLAPLAEGVAQYLDRKRAEEDARRQAELNRVTLASIGDAVITTDAGGNVAYLNAVAQALTGWTQADASGKPLTTVFQIVNEQTRQPVENPVEKALRLGQVVGLANHTVLIARDGTERHIDDSAAPIRDDAGGVVGVVLVFHDITEQRHAEVVRREAERQIATTLESITDGFMRLDREWRVVYVNAEAERLNRLARSDTLGKTLWELFPATVGTKMEAEYRRCVAEQVTVEFENHYEPFGRWYSLKGYPTPDGGLTTFIRDITAVKQAADLLRASEEQRRLALDAAEAGAWNIDPATNLLTSDERFRLVFSGSPAPLDYDQAFAAIHPDDRERVRDAVAAATRPDDPAPYAAEYRVVHPDGAVRWVYAKGRANFVRTEAGRRLSSFDGTVADITARKRLEAQRHQFVSMAEKSQDFIGMAGLDQTPFFLNEAGRRMVGLDPERVSRVQVLDFFYPEDQGRVRDEIVPRVMRDGHADVEIRFRNFTTGEAVWVIWAVFKLFDNEGNHTGIATVSRNITERRRADALLRESEERFRTMADSISQLAWTARPDGHIYWYNRRWHDYTGTTPEEMQGWGWRSVHDPAEVGRVVEKITAHFASGEPWEDTFPLRRHDGEFRWHLSRMMPVRDHEGRVVLWFGTNTDITEQREKEEELRKLSAELSEADRRKDEFLATLAHELRNPLAPIRNGLQVIRLSGATGKVEQARSMMERQLTQLVRLVDDLLDVSRITRGKMELRTERVDLRAVIKAALETTRTVVEQAGHELTVAVPDEPLPVDGDPTRLAQVVSNLLNNSAKYTHRGGHVRLAVRRDGGQVEVAVADDGIGIPPAMLGRVFEMFTQVDRTLEKTTGGLGIGLSLVKGLVEMHGGTIAARSEGKGRGSEFVVRLPVAVADADNTVSSGAGEAVPSGTRRILVVDDNVDSADSLGQLLELLGNEVRTAHDGEAGVRAAGEFRPAVVLMDIGMPRLNGYEAARRIREQSWGEGMVLVALTGWGQDDDRRKTAEAGFDSHMVKPVEAAALMKFLAGMPTTNK